MVGSDGGGERALKRHTANQWFFLAKHFFEIEVEKENGDKAEAREIGR